MDDKDIDLDEIIIDINTSMADDVVLDTSMAYNYTYNTTPGTITIGATGSTASGYSFSNGWTTNSWGNVGVGTTMPSSGLHVSSNATIDGDLTVKGVNITEVLETINKRLAILVPDPAKLEHFEALQKAYKHYKTLEALCEVPKEDTNE